MAIADQTAQPCAGDPVIRPKVYVSPAPMAKMQNISNRFVSGEGFSNGCDYCVEEAPAIRPEFLDDLL